MTSQDYGLEALLARATAAAVEGRYEDAYEYCLAAHLNLQDSSRGGLLPPAMADWYRACFGLLLAGCEAKNGGRYNMGEICSKSLEALARMGVSDPEPSYTLLEAQLNYNLGLSHTTGPGDFRRGDAYLRQALRVFYTLEGDAGGKRCHQTELLLAYAHLRDDESGTEVLQRLERVYDYCLAHNHATPAIIAAYLMSVYGPVERQPRWRRRLQYYFVPFSRHSWLAFRLWAKMPPKRLIEVADFFI